MSNAWTGSYSYNGLQLVPDALAETKTPDGLLATRAVETIAGWVGQIIVAKTIVWESEPEEDAKKATSEANDRLSEKIGKLFK
ncbi:MAG TPA: hypothetical protein VK386_08965 [Acidimicrobiales bacterium]|nr:hypothetical protein [Acidimicrobiales bacterium]